MLLNSEHLSAGAAALGLSERSKRARHAERGGAVSLAWLTYECVLAAFMIGALAAMFVFAVQLPKSLPTQARCGGDKHGRSWEGQLFVCVCV